MSYTVSVSPTTPPSVAGLAADLAPVGGRLAGESAPDGPWPDDGFVRFFVPCRSTRGVECSWRGGVFSIRWFANAAPEDYELGLQILERVADDDAEVRGEYGETARVASLREVFDRAWIADQVRSHASLLAAIVGSQGTMTIPGPVREFHLGPRLLAQLEVDRDGFGERLLDAVRRVQYLDTNALHEASRMQVQAGEERRTFAAWGPEVAYLFPKVQSLLVLEGGNGEPVPVPFAAAHELAPSWEWVDEVQIIVPAVSARDWTDVYRRACAMRDPAFPPPPAARVRRRPWWKFW